MARVQNVLAILDPGRRICVGEPSAGGNPRPGQWTLAGSGVSQGICIQSGGSCTGPRLSAGLAEYRGWQKQILYGNYVSGEGNDAIEVLGPPASAGASDWTEWRDDLSFQNFLADVTWTYQKSRCAPPPAVPNGVQRPLVNPSTTK